MAGTVVEPIGQPVGGKNTIIGEYPALCAPMADLVVKSQSEIDLAHMVQVTDPMTQGRCRITDPLHF